MEKSPISDNKEKISKETLLHEKLGASEVRYRRLFESTKDGILILDAETGKIVDVNPFLIDLLGYSKKEFIEKSIWEIGAFQDIIENKDKFLELQQMEYVRYEDLPLETSDGSKINVEFISNVYLVNNNKVIQCQIRDITARKKVEVALEKTRNELAEIKETADELNTFTENVIDTVREPLLAIDIDLRVIKASRSFYNFFKVTAEETIGKLIYELGNHQWDIPKLRELLEEIIPEKNSFDNYEVEHNFSTIGKRVMLLNARQIKRAFGKEKIILLAIEDITERKSKENTLKDTHRATSNSLNTLLNFMHAPIIIWDTSFVIKRFNRKFELLSGYKSDEVIDKKINFLFPKEKVAATLELLKNHLDGEEDLIEIDILTKDKNIKTVLWNSSRILDEEGKNIIATISQDITSRKHTENALNLLETRYRRLFESAKDGILILDAQTGKIVDVNPFLIDLLGFSKEEFVEKSIWEIGAFQDIYENKERFFELQQEEYVRYDDLPLVTSSGLKINVEFVSNLYMANNIKVIQCNIRDNTERAIAQKEINFQAELINNVGQAVIATNLMGNVIYWNNAAEKIYGWSSSEAVGKNIINLIPTQQSNEQAIDIMKKLSEGKTWAGEFVVKRKDGSSFPAFVTDTPILDSNGELTGIIGISIDITERKQAEKELLAAKEKAEESDRLKSAFLANMSHEIRTPMNGILGFADLLKNPNLTGEKQQSYIRIIGKSGVRMLNIINDIVSISKIESGLMELNLGESNLNEQIEYIYNFFKPEVESKGMQFLFKNSIPFSKAIVKTDREKIFAILSNLVKNAIKYSEKGSIEMGYSKKDGYLEFYVKDSGIGIALDRQKAIFERFIQADVSDINAYQGAGLGLSISKSYVEMLGGKLWVESKKGKGSTFYFTIPYNHEFEESAKIQDDAANRVIDTQAKSLKVLIVDDDETSDLFISIILEEVSNHILHAKSGLEAIEFCHNDPDIDLILMDIKMPEMSGYEATRQIRQFNKNVVVIAQTAHGLQGDREKAIEAGCNDYISKPILKNELRSLINQYF